MDIRNNPTNSRAVTRPLTAAGTKPLVDQAIEGVKRRGFFGNLKDVFVGGGEAIADMGKGLFTMVRHPINTVKGIAFIVGKLVTHPKEGLSMLGHAFVDPYTQAIKDGHPGEALGRGIVEIGSLFVTPGDVAGVAKATATGASASYHALQVGAGVGGAAKAATLAVKLSDQSAEFAEKAAALSKLGYAAEAGKMSQAARLSGKIAGMARAGDVARASRYASMLEGLQHINVAGQTLTFQGMLAHTDLLLDAGQAAASTATAAGRLELAASHPSVATATDTSARGAMLAGDAGTRAVIDSLPTADRMMAWAARAAVVSPFALITPETATQMGWIQQGLPTPPSGGGLSAEQTQAIATQYHLAPTPENVRKFLAEVSTYQQNALGPNLGTPDQVKQLQAALRVAGYDVQPSGAYDSATALAVIDFKRKHGLHQSYEQPNGSFAVNEYVDQPTASALYQVVQSVGQANPTSQTSPQPETSGPTQAEIQAIATERHLLPTAQNVAAFETEIATYSHAVGPDSQGTDVARVQSLLARLGYGVSPTGQFDDATANAVMAFKQRAGIHQTYRMPNGEFAINEYVDPTTELRMRAQLMKPSPSA